MLKKRAQSSISLDLSIVSLNFKKKIYYLARNKVYYCRKNNKNLQMNFAIKLQLTFAKYYITNKNNK